jgi:hypothetical protein
MESAWRVAKRPIEIFEGGDCFIGTFLGQPGEFVRMRQIGSATHPSDFRRQELSARLLEWERIEKGQAVQANSIAL